MNVEPLQPSIRANVSVTLRSSSTMRMVLGGGAARYSADALTRSIPGNRRFGVKGPEGPADRTPPGILSQAAFKDTGETVPG